MKKFYKVRADYSLRKSWNLVEDVFADDEGNIYKIKKGKLTKLHKSAGQSNKLYWTVPLKGSNEKWHSIYVHDLVFSAFNPRYQLKKGECIDHIDGDKHNNRPDNLAAVSIAENTSKFFDGAKTENKQLADSQEYNIPAELLANDVEVWSYNAKYDLTVSSLGRVKRDKRILAVGKNKKYKNNLIIATYINKKASSVSLTKLLADTFLKTPADGRYKTLLKDKNAGVKVSNLYVVPSKKPKSEQLITLP